jgi:hypothetical protein
MKVNFIKYGIGLLAIIWISGCNPGGFDNYEETDIVVTSYDEEYDFSSIVTYYMPDTIHYLGDDDEDPDRRVSSRLHTTSLDGLRRAPPR